MTTLSIDGASATGPAAQRPAVHRSAVQRRVGLAITGLTAAFLAFDAVIHLLNIAVVREAMTSLGFPVGSAVLIGAVEVACLALYLIPRTSVLGAIALTGYLGGAVTAQLRIEAPLFSTLGVPCLHRDRCLGWSLAA